MLSSAELKSEREATNEKAKVLAQKGKEYYDAAQKLIDEHNAKVRRNNELCKAKKKSPEKGENTKNTPESQKNSPKQKQAPKKRPTGKGKSVETQSKKPLPEGVIILPGG